MLGTGQSTAGTSHRFRAEKSVLGVFFSKVSHSVQMVSGPPGFCSAIKRQMESFRC